MISGAPAEPISIEATLTTPSTEWPQDLPLPSIGRWRGRQIQSRKPRELFQMTSAGSARPARAVARAERRSGQDEIERLMTHSHCSESEAREVALPKFIRVTAR